MSAFVLDSSVAITWCFEDEPDAATDELLRSLGDDDAVVPALWHWEVANVLTLAVRRKRIDIADSAASVALLAALPILTDEDAASRALRETMLIAQSEGLTVYDAAYLELAMRLDIPLATNDEELRAAAMRRGVAVLP